MNCFYLYWLFLLIFTLLAEESFIYLLIYLKITIVYPLHIAVNNIFLEKLSTFFKIKNI